MKKIMILLVAILGFGLFAPISAEAAKPQADLVVAISQPPTVTVRTSDTYTVTVTNQGKRTAQNVQLEIDLPRTNTSPTQDFLGELTSVPGNCQITDKITCSLGALRKNQDASVSFNFAFPVSTATLSIMATASTSSSESDTQNNVVTATPAIHYPDYQVSSGAANISRCTGTDLTSYYECELFPSSIGSYSGDFQANGTIIFTGAVDYHGNWNQNNGNNSLYFDIVQTSTNTLQGEFNGYAIGGNCFEGVMVFPNNAPYVAPTKICI